MSATFESMSFAAILESFAARTPTPGGGAAAGLNAALGCSLAAMALRFSVPKKEETHPLLEVAEVFAGQAPGFAAAADADCQAYEMVRDAFRLPKESDAEKAARKAAIDTATIGAMESPLQVMRDIGAQLQRLADHAGQVKAALASDLVSAGWCFRAGCEMAWQNVKINAEGLPEDPRGAAALEEGRTILAKVADLVAGLG